MKKYSKGLAVGATVLWTAFIWGNSLQNSVQSGGKSGTATELLNSLMDAVGLGPITEHFVRKMAHFTEYAVLGILLCTLLYTLWAALAKEKLPVCLLLGLSIPLMDETIQLFVPGRSGEVKDVLLDFSGVLFGLAAAGVVRLLFVRSRKNSRR